MSALLYASATGAILIAAVSLLRLFFGKQLSRSVILVLWLLAVLRLLLPVSLPSPTSIYNLPVFHRDVILTPTEQEPQIPQQTLVEAPAVEETPSAPVVLPPVEEHPALSPRQWLTLVWAAVGAGIFLTVELRHLLHRRRYRFSLPLPEDTEIPAGLRVRMLDGLSSPLTYGLFRPKVLLPVRCVRQPEQLRHILLHEQAHIRYGDLWKKHLFLLTACIHWFNPLVWLMLALAFEDMEIRCDAVAVGKLGTAHKKAYAQTLVSAETARLGDLLQSGFSHSTTARRLKALIHLRRRPMISAVVCVCLVLALTLGFMTGPVVLSAPAEAFPVSETAPEYTASVSIPGPSSSGVADPPDFTQSTLIDAEGMEQIRPENMDPSEDNVKFSLPEMPTEEAPPAETANSGQAYDASWPDQNSAATYYLQSITDVRVNAQADSEIQVLDSTKAWLFVTHGGSFYTDRPDVVSVEGEIHSIEWWNYNWGNFGFYEASVTVTGVSPGTATVFFSANGKEFRLFTVTVVERQVLVVPNEGAVPLGPEG